jgi:hypothetical protein
VQTKELGTVQKSVDFCLQINWNNVTVNYRKNIETRKMQSNEKLAGTQPTTDKLLYYSFSSGNFRKPVTKAGVNSCADHENIRALTLVVTFCRVENLHYIQLQNYSYRSAARTVSCVWSQT